MTPPLSVHKGGGAVNFEGEMVMPDERDEFEDDYCPNCGGEGVVYSCFEEWACVDPESGCDLCVQRCDWCRPLKRKAMAGNAEGD